FRFEVPNTPFQPKEESGPKTPSRAHRSPSRVPFPPTTSASRAIVFKGFLTTLTLPREEVVTVRGPTDRAQPSFARFSLTRSPTSLTLHRAVTGASVPTPFYPTCRGCLLSGPSTRSSQPESCDFQDCFLDSFPSVSRLGNIPLRLREVRFFVFVRFKALRRLLTEEHEYSRVTTRVRAQFEAAESGHGSPS
ncbi:hypothetical protein CRG98_043474, partial [Punica granatum]